MFKPATSFEKYLLKIGYKPFENNIYYKQNGGSFSDKVPANKYALSSMGHLDYTYIKGDRVIIFGLNECKKPATLKWPRPQIKDAELLKGYAEKHKCRPGWSCNANQLDDAINRALLKFSNKKIHDAIFNPNIILDNQC